MLLSIRWCVRRFWILALLLAVASLVGITTVAHAAPRDKTIVEPFRVADEAEFFRLLNLDAPGMAAVKAAVETKDWTRAKQAWRAYLQNRTNPRWFWSYRDRDTIARLLEEKKQSLKNSVPAADNVLKRQFVFVGVPKTLEKSPQWNQGVNDWTSVLNRFPYLLDLGHAWWATGDRKYAQDFSFLINDWIAKNPVPADISTFGVFGNPWRALEDGLRIQMWLEAMQLFLDSPDFDAETAYRMTRSLVEHARYLRATEIRRGYRAGNWQVIEATGLSAIGILFPEFREAEEWRTCGFDTLALHMERDVYPDGAHHELTPGYHMAVADQFLRAALLSRLNGYDPHNFTGRHEKMYEFVLKLSMPDRVDPPIADAGRQSIERSLADSALLYNRVDMRFLSGAEGPAAWVWTFGPDAFMRYARLPSHPPEFTSVLLPDARYAMMRTGWTKDDRYLLLDMAPWGGGHSHKDQLQVILYAGRELLVDPGQYGYDQPLADTYFRKTEAHNIVMVDGKEQTMVNPKLLAWQTTPNADLAVGSIESDGLTIQRSVFFCKPDYWIVVDRVGMSGPEADRDHDVTRLFHFAVRTPAEAKGNIARSAYPDGTNLQIQTVDDARLEMRKGWIPTAAAQTEEAPVAAYTLKSRLPLTLTTVLTPFQSEKDLPVVESIPGNDPSVIHLRLTFLDGRRDEIEIAASPADLTLGKTSGHGRALYLRGGGATPGGERSGVLDGEMTGSGH